MPSPWNRHCANSIDTLSFPIAMIMLLNEHKLTCEDYNVFQKRKTTNSWQ